MVPAPLIVFFQYNKRAGLLSMIGWHENSVVVLGTSWYDGKAKKKGYREDKTE